MAHDLESLFKELRELFREYNPKKALDLRTIVRSYPYMMHAFRDFKPKNQVHYTCIHEAKHRHYCKEHYCRYHY
jgi:hypothetical protein